MSEEKILAPQTVEKMLRNGCYDFDSNFEAQRVLKSYTALAAERDRLAEQQRWIPVQYDRVRIKREFIKGENDTLIGYDAPQDSCRLGDWISHNATIGSVHREVMSSGKEHIFCELHFDNTFRTYFVNFEQLEPLPPQPSEKGQQ